ncbi:unnamed protein product [Paramecium octaurelia]|uniref:Uncharacterized protein n=1 Tax=Paramecium octaurelia TaxID=43137 RepID=A0A8S1XIA4_PAROT|nr:unnamed protein product [Paramecium octaurelia]
MNSLIKKYFNQIAQGNFEAPLANPEKVLEVGNLVLRISQYLNDKELLCFIQINKKIRQLSQECNQLNIRVLQIRLSKQTQILDNYIHNPEYLNTKHCNKDMFYSFYNISMEQTKYIKIQDLFKKKQKQASESQIQKQKQGILKQEKLMDAISFKQINTQMGEEKKIELEKLISEVYLLLSEEAPQPKPQSAFKLNDLTKNLCPIVQYKRVKQLVQKLKGSQ